MSAKDIDEEILWQPFAITRLEPVVPLSAILWDSPIDSSPPLFRLDVIFYDYYRILFSTPLPRGTFPFYRKSLFCTIICGLNHLSPNGLRTTNRKMLYSAQ